MERRIRLLGRLEIEEDGKPAALLNSPIGCALLTYLLVTRKAQSREVLATLFWDTSQTSDSLHNLRQALYRLRSLLPQLQITRREVTFEATENMWVDLHALETGLTSQSVTQLDQALAYYRGELLSGFYLRGATVFNEWLVLEREWLRQRIWNSYRQLCTAYTEQQEWTSGIEAARRWLALDKFDEELHRQLMRFLMADGQVTAAKEQFDICRRLLWNELGVEPEPETLGLYQQIRASSGQALAIGRNHDWGEAPHVQAFCGRQAELEQLSDWFFSGAANLITILGVGGQGKTALAAKAARANANHFESIYWRSLINAPPLETVLVDYLSFLNRHQTILPDDVPAQLAEVHRHLQGQRHLLVLDNLDTVLDPDQPGQFRSGYQGFEQILRLFAGGGHQGTLLVTSREALLTVDLLAKQSDHIVSLPLDGLTMEAGIGLLAAEEIQASPAALTALMEHYSGNPLALQLVAQTIHEFYYGDVDAFLADESLMFADIRAVLDQQFERLSPLEQEILLWLAITREATDPLTLADGMIPALSRKQLLDITKNLQRRSLLVRERGGFTLQNVVMEYLTDHLIYTAVHELTQGTVDALNRYPLMQVQIREYVRQSQIRLILHPVAVALEKRFSAAGVVMQLKQVLDTLRRNHALTTGYAGGTILNLLLALNVDVTGFDFSRLYIRQSDLRGHELMRVNLSKAHLVDCAFTQPFGRIESVAISPDGQLVAGAGDDGEIRIYGLPGGQLLEVLAGHTNTVKLLAFSTDGALLVSASLDGTARIWNVKEWKLFAELNNQHSFECAALSAKNEFVACAGAGPRILLWAFRSGDLFQSPPLHAASVDAVAFAPTGALLASADLTGRIHVWQICHASSEVSQNKYPFGQSPIVSFGNAENTSVRSLAFSRDGALLAGGLEDGTIHLWEIADGEQVHTLTGHTDSVRALTFSVDGTLLFSSGSDYTVRVWNMANYRTVNLLQENETIWSLAVTADGQSLATGSEAGAISLWQIDSPEQISKANAFFGYRRSIMRVRWSPNGRWLAIVDVHGCVRLCEMTAVGPRFSHYLLEGFFDNPALSFSPNSRWLVLTSGRVAAIWDVGDQRQVSALPGLMNQYSSVYVADGSLFATSDAENVVHIWDMTDPYSPRRKADLSGYHRRVRVAGAPNSKMFAVFADRTFPSIVHVYDAEAVQRIAQLSVDNLVSFVVFDPSGKQIAFEGPDFSIGLWSIAGPDSPSLVRSFVGHSNEVLSADFHPDGTLLVSGGMDQTIRLWDVGTGEEVALLGTHNQYVLAVAFSPDGQWVVSAGKGGTLRFWEVETRECLHILHLPGPYEGTDITGITGITESQRADLKALGAVEAHS